jgi:hypothetical protein
MIFPIAAERRYVCDQSLTMDLTRKAEQQHSKSDGAAGLALRIQKSCCCVLMRIITLKNNKFLFIIIY